MLLLLCYNNIIILASEAEATQKDEVVPEAKKS